jgi:hypothetical protein
MGWVMVLTVVMDTIIKPTNISLLLITCIYNPARLEGTASSSNWMQSTTVTGTSTRNSSFIKEQTL